jgi:hypothetical protein
MDNKIVTIEQNETAVQNSPMRLVEMAIQSGADIEKLEKLMDLQDRWEAKQTKKSFLEAMSNFQRVCPDIIKKKDAHNSKYAPLGDIVAQIRAPLADCGLSYRFEQKHDNGITVRCIISHVDGHSESTTMTAAADTSGSKNSIQSIASTVTYLSRYTMTAALGIVTADADMDGRLPDEMKTTIDQDQVQQLYNLLCDENGTYTKKGEKVRRAFKFENLTDIPSKKFNQVLKAAS